jgi:cytochrome c biogenesis protein CcmG/thiol:disulfide interchange protein DsbE
MKKQWILVTVAVLMLAAGAVLGMKLAPEIAPVGVNSRAPSFKAVDLATGDSVSLATYRGQVVLLNVWATWCLPCRVEMPSIQRLHDALGKEGLRIVAVSIDETDSASVKMFQREYGLTFTMLQDRSRAIERIYQTTGVPESFVIDRDGRIVRKINGAHEWDSPADKEMFRRLLARRG